MGAPIVVNTVKIQGTVVADPSTTVPVAGTVTQNATWNVNAIQSGNWNVGGTVNQGGSWTVTANVGSGTFPVSAVAASPLYVSGTTTVTNAAGGALYAQGTVSINGTANVIERGATLGHGSVTITTTAGTIVTANSARRTVLMTNLGTDYVWIGASTAIVVNQGVRVAPGQTFVIDRAPTALVCAIASSGSQVISYFTEED